MDNKKAFFYIIHSIDKDIVEKRWIEYCEILRNIYSSLALKNLETNGKFEELDIRNPEVLNDYIKSFEMNNGSPISFENYQLDWRKVPSHINSFREAKDWVLKSHILRSPAITVLYDDKTIIGGWVLRTN